MYIDIEHLLRLLTTLASWPVVSCYLLGIKFRAELSELIVTISNKIKTASTFKGKFGQLEFDFGIDVNMPKSPYDASKTETKSRTSQANSELPSTERTLKELAWLLSGHEKTFLEEISRGLGTKNLLARRFNPVDETNRQIRNAIVQNLKLNGLTNYDEGYAKITEKGKNFLEYLLMLKEHTDKFEYKVQT